MQKAFLQREGDYRQPRKAFLRREEDQKEGDLPGGDQRKELHVAHEIQS